jgi:hypothetical protein
LVQVAERRKSGPNNFAAHRGHPVIATYRAGNYCGRRLRSTILRCNSNLCARRGEVVDVDQVEVRSGQRV